MENFPFLRSIFFHAERNFSNTGGWHFLFLGRGERQGVSWLLHFLLCFLSTKPFLFDARGQSQWFLDAYLSLNLI